MAMGPYALLVAGAGALIGAAAEEGVAKEVQQAVSCVQAAFNKGDVETLRGLMTPDHVTILT
jgi:predicted lipid-binding transport protein (Tim44 family)